jgi:hypothetical protein
MKWYSFLERSVAAFTMIPTAGPMTTAKISFGKSMKDATNLSRLSAKRKVKKRIKLFAYF